MASVSVWTRLTALALGMAASLVVSAEPKGKSIEVTAVRFWSLGDVTRVAVETSGEFEHVFERIHSPERLFFDIKGSRSRLGRKTVHVIPVDDALIRQIRVAQTTPTVTRVVLDLTTQVEFSCSQLANPSRLMIEVRAPAAAASARPGKIEQSTEAAKAAAPQPAVPPAPEAAPKPSEPKPSAPARADAAVPAKKTSAGERSMTRVLGLKIGRVVLDPGHGGHDTGTIGPGGLLEKDLVLDIARRVGALIEERMASEVLLTRTDDTFVPLERRTEIANEKLADLFLSIHANSSPIRATTGVETFYLNFTTSKADLEVAARENASSEKSIHQLKELLQKIALKDKRDESREFAAKVQNALYGASTRPGVRTRNRGVKAAPFVVLIGAAMPSVLAEIAFLSNPREEGLLKRPDYRQKIAEALFKGLSQYAGTLSHFQVAQKKF